MISWMPFDKFENRSDFQDCIMIPGRADGAAIGFGHIHKTLEGLLIYFHKLLF